VTYLERAQHVAHLTGGNGLSTNQQVELIAAKLEEWAKQDYEKWSVAREICEECVEGRD
jgi:hypothetical protein